MIPKAMWKQLEAAEQRAGPPMSISIVYCGWNHSAPRRDEYGAYLKAWKVGEPDIAITKRESAGASKMYSFDHTKVPKVSDEQT